MAKLSEEVKKMVGELGPALIATASKDGKPNIAPKGSFRVIDDEHIVFVEMGQAHTMANLKENPQLAAIAFDAATRKGYRLWGKAEILESGDLFDTMSAKFASRGIQVKQVVKVAVEEVMAITF